MLFNLNLYEKDIYSNRAFTIFQLILIVNFPVKHCNVLLLWSLVGYNALLN